MMLFLQIRSREGDMRRVVMTSFVALLAIAAAPFAQAQQAADAQTTKAVETIVSNWAAALNKGDAKTVTSFLTPDSITIDLFGGHTVADSPPLIERLHEQGINLTNKVDDVRSLASGQVLLATGTYSVTYTNSPILKPGETATGNWMRVLVKDGSDWKIAAQQLTRLAPPPAASGSSTTK
jgi:ketosteroid isomerase-like protein